jgi:hypothetical protein
MGSGVQPPQLKVSWSVKLTFNVHISVTYVPFLGKAIPVSNLHITEVSGTEIPTHIFNSNWSLFTVRLQLVLFPENGSLISSG